MGGWCKAMTSILPIVFAYQHSHSLRTRLGTSQSRSRTSGDWTWWYWLLSCQFQFHSLANFLRVPFSLHIPPSCNHYPTHSWKSKAKQSKASHPNTTLIHSPHPALLSSSQPNIYPQALRSATLISETSLSTQQINLSLSVDTFSIRSRIAMGGTKYNVSVTLNRVPIFVDCCNAEFCLSRRGRIMYFQRCFTKREHMQLEAMDSPTISSW